MQKARSNRSREDVESIAATNKSLMPEGMEETLKEPEMTNLLEFLTSKGRYVPLPLATVATAISTKVSSRRRQWSRPYGLPGLER